MTAEDRKRLEEIKKQMPEWKRAYEELGLFDRVKESFDTWQFLISQLEAAWNRIEMLNATLKKEMDMELRFRNSKINS